MILRNTLYSLFVLSFLLVTVSSCEKFSGDQTIPAYLSIDSVYLNITDHDKQGAATQHITDVWVTIDNDFMGAFELPAKFPVLKSGQHTVTIWPGIKKDGIAATRTSYMYYSSIARTVNFTKDSTSKLGTLRTSYQATTSFPWKEDFEVKTVHYLDTTSRSTAYIQYTPSHDPILFGNYTGIVVLDSLHDFFECQTHGDAIPISSSPVYLEMDFNTTNKLNVGVFTYSSSYLYQTTVITLNATNGAWKKIYIDLTTTLNAYPGMQSYRVFLGTFKDSDKKTSSILFDNFKLVTR